jgi:endonuclease G
MVPFGFLRGGILAAQAVAKLSVPRYENGQPTLVNGEPEIYLGTGWVIAPGLIMTNHHVVNARDQGESAARESDLREQAAAMSVLFDYDDEGTAGHPVAPGELMAWDEDLDYALVRISDTTRAALPRAAVAIADVRPGSAMAVNIIQHPDGRPKRFGIRNNLLTAATATEIRYFTDTLGGSSGSPVLNDRWEVVALHRGTAFVTGVKFQGSSVAYVNVGTQITAILQHLQKRVPELAGSLAPSG